MRLCLRVACPRRCLVRPSCSPQVPPDLPFFGSIQSVISPAIAGLTNDQEIIPHEVAQSSFDTSNSVADSLLQQPPFYEPFLGVLRLRMLHEISKYLIS